jgi:hypothetical protein
LDWAVTILTRSYITLIESTYRGRRWSSRSWKVTTTKRLESWRYRTIMPFPTKSYKYKNRKSEVWWRNVASDSIGNSKWYVLDPSIYMEVWSGNSVNVAHTCHWATRVAHTLIKCSEHHFIVLLEVIVSFISTFEVVIFVSLHKACSTVKWSAQIVRLSWAALYRPCLLFVNLNVL